MSINRLILEKFQASDSKLLAVTKYFDTTATDEYIKLLEDYSDTIYWYWENRIDVIESKNIVREQCHFIWNIQSRKLEDIINNCWTIHSISSLKYLLLSKKIAESEKKQLRVFLQLQLDSEKNNAFSEVDIIEILQREDIYSDYFQIIGVSGMGSWVFTEVKKREEFQKLIDMRDRYMAWWMISAGTSRDYEIALDMSVDIIRIGNALFQE